MDHCEMQWKGLGQADMQPHQNLRCSHVQYIRTEEASDRKRFKIKTYKRKVEFK